MGIPDGWNDYDRVGKQVQGTPFIAFKVPLKEGINIGSQAPEEKQLHPKLLLKLIPKLGLIIDLTFTYKYYNPKEFLALGVKYQKIKVEGRVIPRRQYSAMFRDIVNDFLQDEANKDKLIGVHCTHGLNRTGFLVCRYMIEEMNMSPLDAIEAFELARGHKMERAEYLNELKNPGVIFYNGEIMTLCPRAIGEYRDTLRTKFSKFIQNCHLCSELALKRMSCPNDDCETALDKRCYNSYVLKKNKCPTCKSN